MLGRIGTVIAAAGLVACATTTAPEPGAAPAGCDAMTVSVDRGTVSGLTPTASDDEIKARLPCATGQLDADAANCAGGVAYGAHQLYAYTRADFLEVRQGFRGRFDVPLLGRPFAEVRELFGAPARSVLASRWTVHLYVRPWGTLRLAVTPTGVVDRVALHAQAPDAVMLCD